MDLPSSPLLISIPVFLMQRGGEKGSNGTGAREPDFSLLAFAHNWHQRVEEEDKGRSYSSDPCELVRIGNDAQRLNTPLLYINGQDGENLPTCMDDHGCLTVNFL